MEQLRLDSISFQALFAGSLDSGSMKEERAKFTNPSVTVRPWNVQNSSAWKEKKKSLLWPLLSLTFTENSFSLPILLPKKKRTALKRLVIDRRGENGNDYF